MIGALVFLLVSVIPAFVIAENIAKRRRRAKWMQGRSSVPDDRFYSSLGTIPVSRATAIKVRSEVGNATGLPPALIAASDRLQALEAVGKGSHPTIVDYFTDLVFVKEPKNESYPITVRDAVIEFGPQLEDQVSRRNLA